MSRRTLLAVLVFALLAVSLASQVSAGQGGSVGVTTDASSYAPGDPITATVMNGTATSIAPLGGIVCQGSPWPFGVQRLDDAGDWQDVVFPRTPPCIGIAAALLGPGESRSATFAADASVGTYRVVCAYTTTDGGGQGLAVSDPYDVTTMVVGTGSDSSPAQPPLMGYLEGQVSIGPLQPVERVGVPPPTPSPAVCTARGLVVFQADTGAEAARFPLGPDCHYSVALAPGSYRVELDRRGIDFSKDLPRVVTIVAGQTTRLDLSIDTGIR
jgi:hypothetical protein